MAELQKRFTFKEMEVITAMIGLLCVVFMYQIIDCTVHDKYVAMMCPLKLKLKRK